MTHCALLSGKWDVVVANDLSMGPQLFKDAVDGKYANDTRWIGRDDFFTLKDTDPCVKYCWSFGNDGRSYIYGRDIEAYKRAVHYELTAPTIRERYAAHKDAVELGVKLAGGGMSLRSLECLESLERVNTLAAQKFDTRLIVSRSDYRDVQLEDGDVIYCDIPYKSSHEQYDRMNGVPKFDYDAFYEWALRHAPVYVSEYEMPEPFVCIAETERCGHMSATNNANRKIERLFLTPF